MMNKETCKPFLNKVVWITRTFDGKPFYSQVLVKDVNDIVLIGEFKGRLQVYDLKVIEEIREDDGTR